MRFEEAVTGTLCGGALLLLMFLPGVEPSPQPPAENRGSAVTQIDLIAHVAWHDMAANAGCMAQ